MNRMMSASLVHSVPGRNRDREVAPTGKEGFPQQETPSSWKSYNPVDPDLDRRAIAGTRARTQPPEARLQTAPTGPR